MATHKLPLNDRPLAEHDPELAAMLNAERLRQFEGIELIASENYTTKAVIECLGSCLTNKYSEGLPGARYYGGNKHIDEIERLCQKRVLEAFRLDPEIWGVNVQPYSGSPANFAAYTALLQPHDRIMGLDLPSGGHLTHGFQTDKKKVSATSVYFESLPYKVDLETGYIDYENMAELAKLFKPKMLIGGGSAYPREWDYKKMREVADSVNAWFMVDMAHISGLVAAGIVDSPFDHADIVTSTTHKTLGGPRSGLIFFRKDGDSHKDFENRVNQAVFPMLQGGPHNNAIGALAAQMKHVLTEDFVTYQKQVVSNSRAFAKCMIDKGMKLRTDGTDNHLVLWDCKPLGLTGSKVDRVAELCHISINKNSIVGDQSAVSPGGVRVGTPAVTMRGMKEEHMEVIAGFFERIVAICKDVQSTSGKQMKAFVAALEGNEDIVNLTVEVKEFARQFPLPGIDTSDL